MEIRSDHVERVHRLLADIRKARAEGVQPRICRCIVCSGVMRDEIERAALAKKDLTLLWGIGPYYARCLEQIGISSYDELLAVDSGTVVEKLRELRCYRSPDQVDCWKHHATSYATSRPVLFGKPLTLDGGLLALDLEYVPGLIWLVGICLVGPAGRDYLTLWADTPEQEKRNLKAPGQDRRSESCAARGHLEWQ